MLSVSNHPGFEAFIIRPDGTNFNEYVTRHYKDEKGRAVTECWLECTADNAVFQIQVEKSPLIITQFDCASWRAEFWVDGCYLGDNAWRFPSNTFIKRRRIVEVNKHEFREENLTFAPADTSIQQGSIVIHLRPDQYRVSMTGPSTVATPIGVAPNRAAKLARATKWVKLFSQGIIGNQRSIHKQLSKPISNTDTPCYEHPDIRQIFIFKYWPRATLETIGLGHVHNKTLLAEIECPLSGAQPPTSSTRRKRVLEVKGKEDGKLDIPAAGGAGPGGRKLEADQDNQGIDQPLHAPSATWKVYNDTHDQVSAIRATASSTRSKRVREVKWMEDRIPNIQAAGEAGPGSKKLKAGQDQQGTSQPLSGPSATIKVDNDAKDQKFDIRAIARLRAHAGSVNGPQTHQSRVQPATQISTAPRPDQITQDPLSVGPVYKHVQIRYGRRGFTEDPEPKVNAAAGPSFNAAPRLPTRGKDSVGEENSEREEEDMWWEIEMHQRAIERLQRGIKDKGKEKKRAKLGREASVKVEDVRRKKVGDG